MLGVGLLSLLVTWWAGPIDDAIAAGNDDGTLLGFPRIATPIFDARGIVPIGYTAFAFVLGVTSGAVLRRTVPAMAVTLVVFVAVQIAVPPLLRSHLGPTKTMTTITAQNLVGLMAAGPDGPVQSSGLNVWRAGPGRSPTARSTPKAEQPGRCRRGSWAAFRRESLTAKAEAIRAASSAWSGRAIARR